MEHKRIGMEGCGGKLGGEEGIKEIPKSTIKPDFYWQQFKTSCCASPVLFKPSKKWGNSHPAAALPGQRCFGGFGVHWALLRDQIWKIRVSFMGFEPQPKVPQY